MKPRWQTYEMTETAHSASQEIAESTLRLGSDPPTSVVGEILTDDTLGVVSGCVFLIRHGVFDTFGSVCWFVSLVYHALVLGLQIVPPSLFVVLSFFYGARWCAWS